MRSRQFVGTPFAGFEIRKSVAITPLEGRGYA
jgi:hypothetical protein